MVIEKEFRISSVCAPQYVMRARVTERVPLHSKSLCKIMARASGGANNMCTQSWGYKRKKSQISKIDAVLKSTEQMRLDLNRKKYVRNAFLNLSKAFDSIYHKILLRRLENMGFDKHATYQFNRELLGERTQRGVLNRTESDWINLKREVP